MTSALFQLTSEDLSQLAAALRSGRVAPPFSPLVLRRYLPERMAAPVAVELQQRAAEGMESRHLADCLEMLCQDRRQRPVADDLLDLVWTGPEAPGIVNRDTSVVVREMFQNARESVMVAGYAVYQGHTVFKSLAERMDQNPQLNVQMFLDIQRPLHDQSSSADLVRRFAERFADQQWPGQRLPHLYYDPRSLETDYTKRASLHAKCIVVDKELAFVSSANFTEAAQTKNLEVGVLIRSPAFARRLSEHFEILAATRADQTSAWTHLMWFAPRKPVHLKRESLGRLSHGGTHEETTGQGSMVFESLLDRVHRCLGPLIERRGFTVESDEGTMGEAWVRLQSEEFFVEVYRDRGGREWITIGSKVRPKPRAHLRNFLLSRSSSYLDGKLDPNPKIDLEAEAGWLLANQDVILDSSFINSEDLRLWNVDAARVLFGQKPRRRLRRK